MSGEVTVHEGLGVGFISKPSAKKRSERKSVLCVCESRIDQSGTLVDWAIPKKSAGAPDYKCKELVVQWNMRNNKSAVLRDQSKLIGFEHKMGCGSLNCRFVTGCRWAMVKAGLPRYGLTN